MVLNGTDGEDRGCMCACVMGFILGLAADGNLTADEAQAILAP